MGFFISIFKTAKIHSTASSTHSDAARRTLRHLIRANHANHSVLHHSGAPNLFLQHIPVLYLLGISSSQLLSVYDQSVSKDCSWQPSPCVITRADWQVFLGASAYAEAYKHYFDDELVHMNYNQRQLVQFYANSIVIPSLRGGDMYSAVHLGIAFILESQEMTSQALTSMCVYMNQHTLLNKHMNTYQWSYGVYTLFDLLNEVAEKKETIVKPLDNIHSITNETFKYISEYVSKWNCQDKYKRLKEIKEATLLLAITTSESIKLPFLYLFNASQTLSILSQNKVLSESQMCLSLQILVFHLLLNYMSIGMPHIQPDKLNHYPSINTISIKNSPHLMTFDTEKLLG